MTRSNAREIVLHLILDMDYTKDPSAEVVETRLEKDYYATLQEENDVYTERPNQKQLDYIKAVTAGIQEKEEELRAYISRYAIRWNVNRISRLARAILMLAMYEILHVQDVPTSVAVNEALVLAKKYETEETAGFINGILGAFVRGENK
ncbi:MAG: transcription antitermination factor NusB [Oscillospiraceae bacterium]|nr:transcription antitermination factor NusB [Oscillospiraceae bacterium]